MYVSNRKKPSEAQRTRIYEANANRCCICHRGDIALRLHHIDENPSNTIDANLAVMCVEDHDRFHFPTKYPREIPVSVADIRKYKKSWERFIRNVRKPKPKYVGGIFFIGAYQCKHKNISDLEAIFATIFSRKGNIEFNQVFRREDGFDEWSGFERIVKTLLSFNNALAWTFWEDPIPYQSLVCPCCKELGHENKMGLPVLPEEIRVDMLRSKGYIK